MYYVDFNKKKTPFDIVHGRLHQGQMRESIKGSSGDLNSLIPVSRSGSLIDFNDPNLDAVKETEYKQRNALA